MPCLDESQVLRLVAGAVQGPELRVLEQHLAGCASCRRLVSWAWSSTGEEEEDDGEARTLAPEAADETDGGTARTAPSDGARPGHELQPGERLGRYVVRGRLGAGAMGVVYLAHDPEIDRRIALKLIRAEGASDAAVRELKRRLLNEARAMARAAHPEVITVHDVGEVGDQVYVAMEYVDGGTLGAWLRERPRGQREVTQLFLRIGRALGAAHAKGLVHRDFKPDNVLVGRDGQVRITDFGLARLVEQAVHTPLLVAGSGERAVPFTRPGAVIGSPAYMAPEQMDGQTADARADLFSFCVALFEALGGARPFAGGTLRELRAAIAAGTVREEPAARIPAWLRRPLLRGLREKPLERFSSMDELLARLERDPRRLLLRGALTGLALLGLAGAAFGAVQWQGSRALLCSGGAQLHSPVWGEARRLELQRAFAASQSPDAAELAARVVSLLDARAGEWALQRTEACAATRLRGEQSEELLDLRMACLDQRLIEERALVDLLVTADRGTVGRAVTAASALAPLQPCADTVRLRSRSTDPIDPGQRAAVEAAREQVSRVKALFDLARTREGAAQATLAVAAARKTGHRPLIAEALVRLGHARAATDDPAGALAAHQEAAALALATGQDELLAQSLIQTIQLLGRQHAFAEAERLSTLAAAAVERAGAPPHLAGRLETERASLLRREGRSEEAVTLALAAVAAIERAAGRTDHWRLAQPLDGLGNAYADLGRWTLALAAHERSLAIVEKNGGPHHPEVAQALTNMADELSHLGRAPEAAARLRRARAILTGAFGEGHPLVGVVDNNLALALLAAGELAEAEETARAALAAAARAGASREESRHHALSSLAEVLLARGRGGEAVPLAEEAILLCEKTGTAAQVGAARFLLARLLWAAPGQGQRALAQGQRARDELRASHSPELPAAERWLAEVRTR